MTLNQLSFICVLKKGDKVYGTQLFWTKSSCRGGLERAMVALVCHKLFSPAPPAYEEVTKDILGTNNYQLNSQPWLCKAWKWAIRYCQIYRVKAGGMSWEQDFLRLQLYYWTFSGLSHLDLPRNNISGC